MAYSHLFFFFFLSLFNFLRVSVSKDNCPSTQPCDASDYYSVSVRFPFRIAEYQSNPRCSYNSNFTLSCNPRKQTLLNLPHAGSFAIRYIDYSRQIIDLTDPDGCLPQRFLYFDLSGSPFYSSNNKNYTYYKCTRLQTGSSLSGFVEPCMSGKDYKVIVLQNASVWEPAARENNCTLIKSVLAPNYNYYNYYNYSYYPMRLYLYWDGPQCKYCEYRGKPCGFKDASNLTECQITTKDVNTSNSSAGIATMILLLVILPGASVIVPCVLACCFFRCYSERTEDLPETQMVRTLPSTSATGLSETDIESNPTHVLGESDVLLEPNVSPCAICLCEYKAGDALRTILDCNHFFHVHCVDEWLEMRHTCPVCRKGA